MRLQQLEIEIGSRSNFVPCYEMLRRSSRLDAQCIGPYEAGLVLSVMT